MDLYRRIKDVGGYYGVHRRYGQRRSWAGGVIAATTHLRPKKTVLFYPERPSRSAVAYKLCGLLGYAISTNPRHTFDVAFKRMDATYFDPTILRSLPVPRIINARCVDISKETVSAAFEEVFSYALSVDPLRHVGPMVEKSNDNYAHDGRILRGPLNPHSVVPGKVYQKLIDCPSGQEGFVLDYRVPIHGRHLPLVYLKLRPVETRFVNTGSAELADPAAVFTPAERATLLRFVEVMGLDYGELDVLRDASDGRIYVVDVNNTPSGPPKGLSASDSRVALARLKVSFDRLLDAYGCRGST